MSRLFTPVRVNTLTLKNRLVMPPMATAKADEAGRVTQAVCDYYQERARYSKVGLIITEHSYVCMQGKAHPGQTSLAEDADLAAWCRLTDCVHRENVRIFAQLSHAGTAASSAVTGQPPVGPSAVFHPKQTAEKPQEMTAVQMDAVKQAFAAAALRAREFEHGAEYLDDLDGSGRHPGAAHRRCHDAGPGAGAARTGLRRPDRRRARHLPQSALGGLNIPKQACGRSLFSGRTFWYQGVKHLRPRRTKKPQAARHLWASIISRRGPGP